MEDKDVPVDQNDDIKLSCTSNGDQAEGSCSVALNYCLDTIEIYELGKTLSPGVKLMLENVSNSYKDRSLVNHLDELILEENNTTETSLLPEISKWESIEPSEEKLNRLDGLAKMRSGKDDDNVDINLSSSLESWLQSHLPDYVNRQQTMSGQKRVRWADIEEKRAQERMRDVGFVVGHTDWERYNDPTAGASALCHTKYI